MKKIDLDEIRDNIKHYWQDHKTMTIVFGVILLIAIIK
tara:strand:- start:402 stop:515 length:114 start_codon:yes stop_codon:yes gene_type:complete